MAETHLSKADYSNLTNNQGDYSVDPANQDMPGTNFTPQWSKWFGYYKVIPELQAVVDKKAIWTVGKGYKADDKTKEKLDRIRGNGKDTFNTIMANAVRVYTIGGDFFAEIIKDSSGRLKNLKPINPGSMTIISNEYGIIIGYEQNIISASKKLRFNPDEIFHLSFNRLGDEPHGISTIQKIENIILMKNEAMSDLKTVFHRYVSPINIWKLDTDDDTEISAFKTKVENTYKGKENLFIPKDTVEVEKVSIPQFSTLDPLPWIQVLQEYFLIAEGVPAVVLGSGKETTEASSKILYLAFQQMVEYNQNFLEEQIQAQLGLDVEFEFPADLMQSITPANSFQKDGNKGAVQPNDIQAK